MKIPEASWDGQKQIVKKSLINAGEYNSLLEGYKETLKQIERGALFNKKDLTINETRAKFEASIGKHQSSHNFHSLFEECLEKSKVRKTPGTVKGLRSSY